MNLFIFVSFVCRNLLIGSFSSLADEELNVNKIIYTQTQVWFVLTNHLCFIRALKRFDTLLENASVWRADALKKDQMDKDVMWNFIFI